MKNWTADKIVDLANGYWFWGERCNKTLEYNRAYFECFNGDKAACDKEKQLKKDNVNGTGK